MILIALYLDLLLVYLVGYIVGAAAAVAVAVILNVCCGFFWKRIESNTTVFVLLPSYNPTAMWFLHIKNRYCAIHASVYACLLIFFFCFVNATFRYKIRFKIYHIIINCVCVFWTRFVDYFVMCLSSCTYCSTWTCFFSQLNGRKQCL